MRDVPDNAQALLDLDKDGALVPHGIGGHARSIITEFIAEHGRLTARIAELEKALAESSERVVHYQKIAGKQGTMLMRKDILLKSARQWGVSSRAFDGSVAVAVSDAIDSGEPLHWPSSHFAQKWLSEQGYSNCDGYVGMRFTMKLADDVQIRQDGARTTLEASERGGGE